MSKQIFLQRQFQALASQNEILRAKTLKINEIQAYVNILMQSTQKFQDQLNRSNLQNKQLKNRIDRVMAQNLILEKNYQADYRSLQSEFKKQLAKKDQDFRKLNQIRQKDKNTFQQTIRQSQNRSKNDIQRIKMQFLHIQSQYEAQIKKLVSNVNQKSKDYEKSERQKSQIKKQFIEQISSINLEINNLQRAYQESQSQNKQLKEQLEKLSNIIQGMIDSQHKLKRQLVRRQQEIRNDKKIYQNNTKMLEQNLNQLQSNSRKVQSKSAQLNGQNQRLKKQMALLTDQTNELSIQQKNMQRYIDEKEEEIKQIKIKYHQQQEEYKRSIKRTYQQLKRLQEELKVSNQRYLNEKRNSESMKKQIQDLLKVVDRLEDNLAKAQHDLSMANKQNSVLFKEVQNLNKELNSKNLQINDLDIMYHKTKENALTLQEMLNRQKTKYQILQKQNNEIIISLESLTKQQKSLQQQQLSNLLQRHLAQKRQILEYHRTQKEAIVRKYEQALRQKDQEAKKRLLSLEEEISLIRVRH